MGMRIGRPRHGDDAATRRTTARASGHISFIVPPVGICVAAWLLTITSSYLRSLPLTHWPSTSGVLLTFLNGPCPPHLTGPTTVERFVAATASRTSAAFS